MSPTRKPNSEMTPVDDVRVVREAIAAQHGGDLESHLRESNRIFKSLQKTLKIKMVRARTSKRRRVKTG